MCGQGKSSEFHNAQILMKKLHVPTEKGQGANTRCTKDFSANLPCQEHLQEHPGTHPLFDPNIIPGGGLSARQPDWMHTKLLGTDATLLGSCIVFMVKEIMPGGIEQNLTTIWSSVRAFYKENKTKNRMGRLTYKMVKHEPFPRLAAKALETRDLVPAMENFMRPWVGNPQCAYFHRLLLLSSRLDAIVFNNKTFMLSGGEREAIRAGIFEYHQILTTLAHHFHGRAMAYCNFTPKNHFLCHLGLIASKTGVSPRLGFCFQGEDFMNIVKSLCIGSQRGVEAAKLFDKVAVKYLRGLDFLLGQEPGLA